MSGYVGLVGADGMTPLFTTTNPGVIAGANGTSAPSGTNQVPVSFYSANGTQLSTQATNVDSVTTATANTSGAALQVRSAAMVFNGTTWDRARGDVNGTVTQPFAMAANRWNYAAAASGIVNTITAVTIAAAAGASVRNYLTALQIDHDTLGAATEIAIRDGAAGTVLWRGRLQTTAIEGGRIVFDSPLKGTANTLMEVATLSAVTGGVYVNAQGFTGT